MKKVQQEILDALKKQEAVLVSVLESVRQAIRTIQPEETSTGYFIKFQPTGADGESLWLTKALAEVGSRFTTLEIYERAKKIKPGLQREALKRALGRLIWTGAIQKIEEGRGRRPARFEKRIFN